jgi:hypothetical protein
VILTRTTAAALSPAITISSLYQPAPHQARRHPPAEAMAMHKQFLVDPVPNAGEQL